MLAGLLALSPRPGPGLGGAKELYGTGGGAREPRPEAPPPPRRGGRGAAPRPAAAKPTGGRPAPPAGRRHRCGRRRPASRGVTFEEYETPKTVNFIATIGPARGAWFKDPSGNVIGVREGPVPGAQ